MHDPQDYDVDDPEADELLVMDPWNPQYEYNEERHRQKCIQKLHRRSLRDHSNPFDVTYESFVSSYRLLQDLAFSLIDIIRPFMRQTTSALAVPLELKVWKHQKYLNVVSLTSSRSHINLLIGSCLSDSF